MLKLAEVVAFTVPENLRSIAVMKRLGMQDAGEFLHPRTGTLHSHIRTWRKNSIQVSCNYQRVRRLPAPPSENIADSIRLHVLEMYTSKIVREHFAACLLMKRRGRHLCNRNLLFNLRLIMTLDVIQSLLNIGAG